MKNYNILLFILLALISSPSPANQDLYKKGRKAAMDNNHIDCVKYLYAFRTIYAVRLETEDPDLLVKIDSQIKKSESILRTHFLSTTSGTTRDYQGTTRIIASGRQKNPYHAMKNISPSITPIKNPNRVIIFDSDNEIEPLLIHLPENSAILANQNSNQGLADFSYSKNQLLMRSKTICMNFNSLNYQICQKNHRSNNLAVMG